MSSGDTFKVCLLGEGRVGKTSLVRRFTADDFSDKEHTTIQANMYSKKRLHIDGRPVTISIWDTAGQERFHALGPIYYRDANGALLVYDITDADTFDRVKHWIKELKSVVGDDIEVVVCGNKGDLERHRQVDHEAALAYCKAVGAEHFVTSAKLSKNVAEAFAALTRRMVEFRARRASLPKARSGSALTGGRGNDIRIVDDEPVAPKSSTCC